jgi:PAS domain-containing protein
MLSGSSCWHAGRVSRFEGGEKGLAMAAERTAERRDRGADDRDVLARRHQQTATDRGQLASDQDQTSSDHDQTASGSDQQTADADQRAADDAESAAAAQRAVETLEAMSDGFFTLDLEGRFTYLNAQSETFLERRREKMIGKVLEDRRVRGSRP